MAPLIDRDAGDGNFWVTWMYYPTHTRLDGLLVGISIAGLVVFYPALKERLAKFSNLLLIAGILILTGAFLFVFPGTVSTPMFLDFH